MSAPSSPILQPSAETAPPLSRNDSSRAGKGAPTRLHGRALILARIIWASVTAITLTTYLATIVVRFQAFDRMVQSGLPDGWTDASFRAALAQIGMSPTGWIAYNLLFGYTMILGSVALGLLIFSRRSDEWFALYVSIVLITLPASRLQFANLTETFPSWSVPVELVTSIGTMVFEPFFFLFPDGSFVPRWGRWLSATWIVTIILSAAFPQSALDVTALPAPLWILMQLAFIGSGIYAQIYRYRRVSGDEQRQQTKWVVFGVVIMALIISVFAILPTLFPAFKQPGAAGFAYVLITPPTLIAFILLPLTIAIAILRYRLWDIDLIINRSLVYIPLTAILAGIFAAAITLCQKAFVAFTGQTSDLAAVLSTLLVVAAFTPIKERLQNAVDRRFKDADPTKRLKAFDQQVQTRMAPVEAKHITRRLLDEAIASFGASGGAAFLGSDSQPLYVSGQWNGEAKVSAVLESQERGNKVGSVALGARRNKVEYTAQDRAALEQAARVVAHAIEEDGAIE